MPYRQYFSHVTAAKLLNVKVVRYLVLKGFNLELSNIEYYIYILGVKTNICVFTDSGGGGWQIIPASLENESECQFSA